MKPQVRQIQDKDFSQFQSILLEFLQYAENEIPAPEEITKLFSQALDEDSNYFVFCLELEKQIGGLISVTFGESSYRTAPFAWCDDFFIKKEFRRKGYGRLLIAAATRVAQEKSCSNILVGVGNQEIETMKFYEKVGFKDLECKLYSLPLAD
ncbi:GNAT family N-acetyltransferase [candidate division CSSED10-310 bacterium]|uniref:GNAT family N-acetyltransferase n=1 Tax=candidate division CSSED10-310 bacterium TaxID=2855610 RepID=A0ABV6YYU7_UNCC1